MASDFICIVNKLTKIPFCARVLRKGTAYGLNDCLTWDEDRLGVEFYDRRYPHTQYGQFVTRYYVSTLLGTDDFGSDIRQDRGLCLDGGIPDWSLDASACKEVGDWLASLNQ